MLKVSIQMDPVETFDIKGDSTFALGLEAQRRGHALSYYLPQELSLYNGTVRARPRPLTLRDDPSDFFTKGDPVAADMAEFDVVLMRQDPPFDMGYITATHILEHIHPETLVVNHPEHVRNAPEKLFTTLFSQFMPPTLITKDPHEVKVFRAEYGDIVFKPLFGNGGEGVVRVRADDQNLNALLEIYSALYVRQPIMVQAYLPEIREGDKRVILVDGEPVGAINRRAAPGEVRSNLHVGGTAEAVALSERDREICAALGPVLKERGLIFVGIDVIGNYLTEINVTSPTGIRELKRFDGTDAASLIWDAIEARRGG